MPHSNSKIFILSKNNLLHLLIVGNKQYMYEKGKEPILFVFIRSL